MIVLERVLRTLAIAGAAGSLSILAAHAQDFHAKRGSSGPPVENHPKVDEKAYKAALERIPVPTEKYDPWGGARANDPDKPTRKTN